MPYRRIQFVPGQYYHIYNRGSRQQNIFREEENYLFVLRLMKKYAAEFHITVIAYCLMPNHYHFLVRQEGADAAGLLPRRVFNSYAKAFNKRYGLSGALLEGRYKVIRVDKEEYLIHLCRYIHSNPVKDGIVARVADWPYSNYHEWTGTRNGTLIDREFVRAFFPTPARYGQFVQDYLDELAPLPENADRYLLEDA